MRKAALISAAHIHTPQFIKMLNNRRDAVQVKTVWDSDPQRARKAAEELHGARVAADPAEIWRDREIEAAIICSETRRHEELAIPAAEAGKHLFIEKPLGFGAEDAARIASAIERAGVLFQTGYFMRSGARNRWIRRQIGCGALGKITRARFSNCHSGALRGFFDSQWRWMADPGQAGCGGFGDLGAHAVDLLIWMLGDVEEVAAKTGVALGRYEGVDEYGEGLLKLKNGTLATLAAGWVDHADPIKVFISGTEGAAWITDAGLFFKSENVEGADGKEVWTRDLEEPLPHAFELFLDALDGKEAPLVTVQEAAYGSKVIAAMYQAADGSEWTKV